MIAERVLKPLRAKNPNLVVGGVAPFPFEMEAYDFNFTGHLISIWDPISIPKGLRKGNTIILTENTYFSSISHHLSIGI